MRDRRVCYQEHKRQQRANRLVNLVGYVVVVMIFATVIAAIIVESTN